MIRGLSRPRIKDMNARSALLLVAAAAFTVAEVVAEDVDLAVVHRIKAEARVREYVARQRGKLRGRIVLIEPHVDSQRADLMQAAAIVASFAYNAAMRKDMLPRKPLPKPLPAPRADPAR
jgi:hypothetical protein